MITRISGAAIDGGVGGFTDARQDHRQFPRHRGKSHDRQFLDRKQRHQALARHGQPADALEPHGIAEPLPQHLHQAGAEPVAGFLRRDQKYLSRAPSRLASAAITPANLPRTGPLCRRLRSSSAARRQCVLPAIDGDAGQLRRRGAFDGPRGPSVGRSKRRSCPLFGAFTSTPRPGLARMRPSARSRATRASNPSVPSMSSTPSTWPSTTIAACPISNGLSARNTSRPLAISALASRVRSSARQTALRHQQIRRDILDADHPKTVFFQDAADAGQQMIVAAAEGFQHTRHGAKRFPVEPDLGQRGPHQRADKHQIAAVFSAQ